MSATDREETIFGEVQLLPPGERAAYLDQACGGDADLRRCVEELLQAHEGGSGFMQGLSAPTADKVALLMVPPCEKPGDRIGR